MGTNTLSAALDDGKPSFHRKLVSATATYSKWVFGSMLLSFVAMAAYAAAVDYPEVGIVLTVGAAVTVFLVVFLSLVIARKKASGPGSFVDYGVLVGFVLAIGRDLLKSLAVLGCIEVFYLVARTFEALGLPKQGVELLERVNSYMLAAGVVGIGILFVLKLVPYGPLRRSQTPRAGTEQKG